jgi:hypothetical protein
MKQFLLLVLTALLISACSRTASTAEPTMLPLNFPVLAPAVCQPADLQTSSNSNATADAIIFGITLTNQTNHPCEITNPATVQVLNASGEPFTMQTTVSPAVETPPAPATVVLAPKTSTILTVVWRNFCQLKPVKAISLQIFLSEKQTLELPMNVPDMTGCTVGSEASSMMVIPYSDPP